MLPPRSPRRPQRTPLSERPLSALGRPLPRAATWLLLIAGSGASVALVLPQRWRAQILGIAVALFAVVALWRLGVTLPGNRGR